MDFCGECGEQLRENEVHRCGSRGKILSSLANVGVSFNRSVGFIGKVYAKFKELPIMVRQGLTVLIMFFLSDRIPWKAIFGAEMGGYVQAAMVLGAIFMLLKLVNSWKAMSEGKQ